MHQYSILHNNTRYFKLILFNYGGGKMKKVVLACSGGLDTSVILKWLISKGYEVIAYVADVGQQEDFAAIKEKTLNAGASKVYVEDLKAEFAEQYVMFSIKAGAIYEDRYLMGTSLARPLIAKKQIEIAIKENAEYVSHGATGKGNDQVRFELTYYALHPTIKVIAPWKTKEFIEQFKGRSDLLNFAKTHNIPVTATHAKPYSIDANLIHISYEAGILEDPKQPPEKDMFLFTVDPKDAPDKSTFLSIHFDQGVPVKVMNVDTQETILGALEIVHYCNQVGAKNGVGRLDMVENRYVGIKSRGIYETPGLSLLWKAHQDLESITLDKEVFRIKQSLVPKISDLIYNGYWFSPEMRFLQSIIDISQKNVTGIVHLELYKGNVIILGRESPASLYNQSLSSMDEEGGYNQEDAQGFIHINAVRLKNDTLTKRQ